MRYERSCQLAWSWQNKTHLVNAAELQRVRGTCGHQKVKCSVLRPLWSNTGSERSRVKSRTETGADRSSISVKFFEHARRAIKSMSACDAGFSSWFRPLFLITRPRCYEQLGSLQSAQGFEDQPWPFLGSTAGKQVLPTRHDHFGRP